MIKRNLHIILILLLLLDICYSFIQHYHTQLDGDIAGGVVPSSDVQKILDNPFGLNVLLKNQVYPNPNRFFSHWIFSGYFKTVPLIMQKFADPIDSIYLSCALAKTIIQIIITFLLAFYISGARNIFNKELLIAAILITPLFQTNGYQSYMGIIDKSITYTFFYALPVAFLLIYFLPFLIEFYHNKKFTSNIYIKVIFIVLAVIISLSGPLNPGIVLIISAFIFLNKWQADFFKLTHYSFSSILKIFKNTPKNYLFFLVPISILSIYSLYIGSFNSISIQNSVSLSQLYSRLPAGIYYQFTQKLGFPLLFLMISVNVCIIKKKYNNAEGQKILRILKWILIFTLVYIILLPLGGYRDYRPNILRYDTIMPITICLIFIYGISTYFLINNISPKYKKLYLSGIVVLLLIFTYADKLKLNQNICERQALEKIAQSKEKIVFVKSDCTIMSWEKTTDYKSSELNAQLLQYWNVTKEKKLFYQK